MIKVLNKLRILGNDTELVEVKAFLETHKEGHLNLLDLEMINPQKQHHLSHIKVDFDTYDFESEEDIIDEVKMLSKRFHDIKFSYQYLIEKEETQGKMLCKRSEFHHQIICHGDIINQSSTQTNRQELIEHFQQIAEENNDDTRDLDMNHSMIKIQDKFVQFEEEMVQTFRDMFFHRWF